MTTDPNRIPPYPSLIPWFALNFGVRRSLIAAIIHVESAGDPDAVSEAGAVGLMQVMPSDCKDELRKFFEDRPTSDALRSPYINIVAGLIVLTAALRRARGDVSLALALYYGGVDESLNMTADGKLYGDLVLRTALVYKEALFGPLFELEPV